MANYKKIVASCLTGSTVYCMVSRDVDGYFLATDKASFASGAGYPAMTEHATVKSLYVLNTNDVAWDDGLYTVTAYRQAGASAAPASDTVIGFGVMRVLNDLEVSSVNTGVSYQDGAIWIDTTNGTAGTTPHANGTADNPVDSLADALTLATALGINRFRVAAGSAITFTANQQNQQWIGYGATINGGNKTHTGSYFEGATLTGTLTGAIRAKDCILSAIENFTGYFLHCVLSGSVAPAAGNTTFARCVGDGPASAKNATLDLWIGNCTVSLTGYQGKLTVANVTANDTVVFHSSAAELILAANCTAGEILRTGFHNIVDNSAGTTVYDLTATAAVQSGLATASALATVAGYLDTEIADIKTKTDLIPTGISTSVMGEVVEGTLTLLQVLRILLAEAAGITTGSRTSTLCFRDQADTKNRITGTMDTTGNRTSTTLDAS